MAERCPVQGICAMLDPLLQIGPTLRDSLSFQTELSDQLCVHTVTAPFFGVATETPSVARTARCVLSATPSSFLSDVVDCNLEMSPDSVFSVRSRVSHV